MKKNSNKILGIILGLTLIGGIGFSINTFNKGSVESSATTPAAGTTYKLITSVNDLVVGANYTIASIKDGSGYVARTIEDSREIKALSITVSNYILLRLNQF